MGTVRTSIYIARPPALVFDYVTTAANWPRWHPSSLGVSGAIDHPAQLGEQITEQFRVAGRKGEATWTVRERDAPRRFAITGTVGTAGGGTVTYVLSTEGAGTHFERTFSYRMNSFLLSLLDPFLLRPRIARESAAALRRLKAVLEGHA